MPFQPWCPPLPYQASEDNLFSSHPLATPSWRGLSPPGTPVLLDCRCALSPAFRLTSAFSKVPGNQGQLPYNSRELGTEKVQLALALFKTHVVCS